jgi:hypothetical protein
MRTHLPSIEALVAGDDRRLHEELSGLSVRKQTAVVRMLMDQLEVVSPWSAVEGVRAQLVEELARLGCLILQAAASMSSDVEPAPVSGTMRVCESLSGAS